MTALSHTVEDYLTVRRTLVYKLVDHGTLLPDFVAYLEAGGASTVTTELAVAWATRPTGTTPAWWGTAAGSGAAALLAISRPSTPTPRSVPGLVACVVPAVSARICTPRRTLRR